MPLDACQVILAISRGDCDSHLGDIAQALEQRHSDLEAQQLAASLLAAFADRTDMSVAELLAEVTDANVP